MSAEQLLLKFDKKKENIPRQITSVVATRQLHIETGQNRIAGQIKDGKRQSFKYEHPETAFELEGVKGVIKKQEDALIVAASLARYNYSIENAFISDLGAGLYTMITTNPKGLYKWQEVGTKDPYTDEFEATGARIMLSAETLYKAMFGPCVDDNGRAITGAGSIIKKAKERIMPILSGKVPMPRAYASVQKNTDDGIVEAVIEGEPIRVYRKKGGKQDAFIIDLDYFFFPALQQNGKLQTNDLYIHSVAGLTTFLRLGSYLMGGGKKKGIQIETARKIILAAQAAFELRYFAPGIVKENTKNRINIALRRSAVGDLYPAAINNNWIDYTKFSDAVAQAGEYFDAAMEKTGIKDELLKKGNVIVPATSKGAEFPKEHKNIVYIKADKI